MRFVEGLVRFCERAVGVSAPVAEDRDGTVVAADGNLRQRVDPKTGLVRPFTAHMARELGVSRSTISRELRSLRQSGVVELVYVRESPKILTIYYRLKD